MRADTHLMDPLLFQFSTIPRRCLPAHSRVLSSLPLPVFLLSLSLCHSVIWSEKKLRESLQGQAILSFRQRGSQTVELNCRWSTPKLLVDWPVELRANLARRLCSTTAYRQIELRVTSSELTAAKLRVSNLPPPPTRLHLFCSCFAFTPSAPHSVTTFHLIEECPHLLFSIDCRPHTFLESQILYLYYSISKK